MIALGLAAQPHQALAADLPFAASDHTPISGVMQHLDLSDEEAAALARVLNDTIDGDRYPLSPRVQMLQGICSKAETPW